MEIKGERGEKQGRVRRASGFAVMKRGGGGGDCKGGEGGGAGGNKRRKTEIRGGGRGERG